MSRAVRIIVHSGGDDACVCSPSEFVSREPWVP